EAKAAPSAPKPAGKLKPSGVTRLKFDFYVAPDGIAWDPSYLRTAHVWIGPASVYHDRSDDMVAHGWEAQYLDDGRQVVAVKVNPRRYDEDGEHRDGQGPDRYQLAALKRVRHLVLGSLEADLEVYSIHMDAGGDGRTSFMLCMGKTGDVTNIHVRLVGEDE